MQKSQRERAKQVILEIVRQGGGTFTRTTNLYKAFYFAHLFYAENAPDYLSEWPIVRMPNGPGIDAGAGLLSELVNSGFLNREMVAIGPYEAACYRLTDKPWPDEGLSPEAIRSIQMATKLVMQKSATELSDLTHEFSRSWNKAADGQRLNCYIDLIPEEDYETRQRNLESLRHRIAAVRQKQEVRRHEPASQVV